MFCCTVYYPVPRMEFNQYNGATVNNWFVVVTQTSELLKTCTSTAGQVVTCSENPLSNFQGVEEEASSEGTLRIT